MYSIAQQAVANGYGKIENLRAHPRALSSRVRTAVSPSNTSSPFDSAFTSLVSAIDASQADSVATDPKGIKRGSRGSTKANETSLHNEAILEDAGDQIYVNPQNPQILLGHPQYRRAFDFIVLEHLERDVRLGKAERNRMRANRNFARDLQELLRIGAGICGDASNLALVEQMLLVVQFGNRTQIDSGNRENAAAVERFHRGKDEVSGRRKKNGRIERRRGTIVRLADPIGAKLRCKIAMQAAAAHHKHAATPMLQHLQCDMRRTTETIKADRGAGLDAGALDGAKADDARAHQWRGFFIANRLGQRINEIFARDRILGVAAVVVPSGEAGIRAQILAPAQAIDALPTGIAQPRDSDSRALRETRCAHAVLFDDSYNFVARDYPRMLRRQVAFGDMEIGAAYSASADAHENLARRGLGNGRVDRMQRRRFDRRGFIDCHRFHCGQNVSLDRFAFPPGKSGLGYSDFPLLRSIQHPHRFRFAQHPLPQKERARTTARSRLLLLSVRSGGGSGCRGRRRSR